MIRIAYVTDHVVDIQYSRLGISHLVSVQLAWFLQLRTLSKTKEGACVYMTLSILSRSVITTPWMHRWWSRPKRIFYRISLLSVISIKFLRAHDSRLTARDSRLSCACLQAEWVISIQYNIFINNANSVNAATRMVMYWINSSDFYSTFA